MSLREDASVSHSFRLNPNGLSPARLDQAARQLVFDTLPAAYAHRDWLGDWAPWFERRGWADERLLRRASFALCDEHGLQPPGATTTDDARGTDHGADATAAWWLLPSRTLLPIARTLGIAMLGGWVRGSLDRAAVGLQLRLLSLDERTAALAQAGRLRALPFTRTGDGWPIARNAPSAVTDLGLSCMAALLAAAGDGRRGRFALRFARERISALRLDAAQHAEALGLVHDAMHELPGNDVGRDHDRDHPDHRDHDGTGSVDIRADADAALPCCGLSCP